MSARQYSSIATPTTLTSAITNSQTSFVVGALTGWASTFPYTGTIDPDTANEEAVTVTAAAGNTVTVIRGIDGFVPIPHAAGAVFDHRTTARDFQEPQNHIYALSGVHGITGNVVGDSDAQALTNKILDGTVNTFQNVPAAAIVGGGSGAILSTNQSPAWSGGAGLFNPVTTPSAISTTYATVSFTVPVSGKVKLTFTCLEFSNYDGFYQSVWWQNRSGGATVGSVYRLSSADGYGGTQTLFKRPVVMQVVSGLTPGASLTLDAWASVNGGTGDAVIYDCYVEAVAI